MEHYYYEFSFGFVNDPTINLRATIILRSDPSLAMPACMAKEGTRLIRNPHAHLIFRERALFLFDFQSYIDLDGQEYEEKYRQQCVCG